MLRLPTIALLLWYAVTTFAQDFRTPWICCPDLKAGQQAWFREVVELDEAPSQAWLSVLTTGYVDIYINERNITTALRTPYREADDEGDALGTRWNVTRFLGKGRNLVAIHYSPTSHTVSQRQVAARLWGHYVDGSPFALPTDDEWLCRPANGSIGRQGQEVIDSRYMPRLWRTHDIDLPLWIPAEAHPMPFADYDDEEDEGLSPTEHIVRTLEPTYIQSAPKKVYAIFKEAFNGYVRVTLRKCKAGERLRIDNIDYTCSGEFDEQACARFTVGPHRIVVISGDEDFLPEQVFSIEGLEIAPTFSSDYWP